MKVQSLLGLSLLVSLGLHAQAPVQVSLSTLLQEMPAPPRTVEEAWHLMDPTDATKYGAQEQAFETKLLKVQTDIVAPPGVADLQQKYADPAFQKQMEAMSTEEKVAMAMKMQAEMQARMNAGGSRPHPPSPEMRAAIAAFQQFQVADAQNALAKSRTMSADMAAEAEIREKEKATHDRIDADAIASFGKLAFKDGNESPAAIAAQRKIDAAAWQRHFPLLNERLAAHRQAWEQAKAELVPVVTTIDAQLAAINYAVGESVTNRQLMSSYQSAGVRSLLKLFEQSRTDLTYAASWYQRYENWKKSAP